MIKGITKSKNLFDGLLIGGHFTSADFDTTGDVNIYKSIKVFLPAGTYVFSWGKNVNVIRTIIDGTYTQTTYANIQSLTITTTTGNHVGISFRDTTSAQWDATTTIMLNSGSTALPYEPYGDIPKDIIRIPMKGKQLWDEVPHAGYITSDGTSFRTNGGTCAIIPCDPKTTYTVNVASVATYNRLTIATCDSLPKNYSKVTTLKSGAGGQTAFTVTTGTDAAYLIVYLYSSQGADISGLMVSEGSTALPYEPYGMQNGWEVRDQQGTILWGADKTLTGTDSISFKGYGLPLKSWTVQGNGQQSGTPSPQSIIMPTFCGVRTGNLLNLNRTYSNSFTTDTTKWMNGAATVNNAGIAYAETEILGDAIKVTSKFPGYGASFLIEASPNTAYTVSFETDKTSSSSWGGISDRDINGTVISNSAIQGKSATFTTHDNCAFLNVCFRFPLADGTVTFSKIMLNSGSTALPYEPYGWAEKITCAGQTTPVYLGQTQTVRRVRKLVLTGEENINIDTYLRFSIYVNDIKTSTSRTGRSYCSHYECLYHEEPYDNDWNNVYYQSGGTLYFHDRRFTAVADFKQYLRDENSAGHPVTVWYVLATPTTGVVNEPLCKIGDYADELHSEDAAVTIQTANGNNTLTVDTTLPPSGLSITGHVKSIQSET